MFSAGPGLQDLAGGDTQQRQGLGCFKCLQSHFQLPGLGKSRKGCPCSIPAAASGTSQLGKILNSAKFSHDNVCGSSSSSAHSGCAHSALHTQLCTLGVCTLSSAHSGGLRHRSSLPTPGTRRSTGTPGLDTAPGLQPSQQLHFGIKPEQFWDQT